MVLTRLPVRQVGQRRPMVELKDIIKTENIIRISPEETLASTLSRMRTSHDSAFVFNSQSQFMGVINPYYSLIKSSFPGNAKVKHCLYHPPKVRINYSIPRVAELFVESKVHYLPVFDDDDLFIGIISARHLLSYYLNSTLFTIPISQILKNKNKPIITIYEEETITTAVNLFKKTKVSKLVVIGKDFKLKGVLSHYDLIAYLVSPRSSPHRGEREGNHISFYHQKVKNFAKTYALTLGPDDIVSHALKLIIYKKIGSIVIVDRERHPIGVVTTKDFLKLLMRNGSGKRIDFISKNLSQKSRQIVGGFFNYLSVWMRKIPDVARARLFVEEEKQGHLFKVAVSVIPKKGNPQVIKREGKNLAKVLQDIKKN